MGSFPFLRQSPGRSLPSGHREGRTSQKRKGAGTWGKNSKESMVEPRGEERIKGTAAEEGLHTLEMSFAVDPHGSGVHGSRPAPTYWVRDSVAPGGHENTATRGRFISRSLFPFRKLPHPRNRDAASTVRVSGTESDSKARRRKK